MRRGTRAIALALSLSLLLPGAACSCSKRTPAGDGGAGGNASAVTRWPGVTLARSTSSALLQAGIETVGVGATSMYLEGGGEIALLPPAAEGMHGFDARYKHGSRNDYYLVPLATALGPEGGKQPSADVAFAFDAGTAYRLVAEAIYTAGQRADRMHLAVDHGGSIAEIVGEPPRAAQPQPMLTVIVTDEGYVVSTPAGRVGAGCGAADAAVAAAGSPGAGTSVPKRFGGFDAAALTACVSRLAREESTLAGPGKHEVYVTAEPGSPFRDMVQMLDAVRTAPDGTPLFTEVRFGVAK